MAVAYVRNLLRIKRTVVREPIAGTSAGARKPVDSSRQTRQRNARDRLGIPLTRPALRTLARFANRLL